MTHKLSNVEAILAVDINFGLAKDGNIPWKSKTDLQFFKSKTVNNVVVMGSKTLLSLPNSKPLNNRLNIILTNNYDKYSKLYEGYDNIYFVNYKNIINLINYCYKDKTIFIVGGNQIYNLLLPYCSTIWLTKIKENYDCDLVFDYDISKFKNEVTYEDNELIIMRLN
jgi:dihydrofolate reductase